jgi:sec-independent protein translocase protein TatA
MGIGMRELIVILLVCLVVFGAKKLRTVGSDLGHAVRGFKKAMGEGENEESTPPKQIRSEGTDAEFPEVAKREAGTREAGKTTTTTDRPA